MTGWVQDLVNGLTSYLPRPEPAQDAMQDAGFNLIDPRRRGVYTTRERMGYLLILHALIASPGAAQQAQVAMRDALIDADPALGLVLRPAEERPARLDGSAPGVLVYARGVVL